MPSTRGWSRSSIEDILMMNETILAALHCPKCGEAMTFDGRSLLCSGPRRHCYDAAASGYVNLAPEHRAGGDSREAVRARTAFLGRGYYASVADGIEALAAEYARPGEGRETPLLCDAGCGEGYYTGRLAGYGAVCGFDLSRTAVEAGAKAARREGLDAFYAVAGLYSLPLRDGSVDFMLNHFAPCAEAEFCRVLRPGGVLVIGAAGEEHLLGLKRAVYDAPVRNEIRADLPTGMTLLERRTIREVIRIEGQADIAALFAMTPYYYRTSEADRAKLAALNTLETEIEVDLSVYRRDA